MDEIKRVLRPVTEEEKAKIIELYKEGKSYWYISRIMHMSRQKISLLCDVYIEQGLMERKEHSRACNAVSVNRERYEQNLAKALELVKAGKTYAEVADAIGIKSNTAIGYIRELIKRGLLTKDEIKKNKRAASVFVDSTLEPGQTINCTSSVNAKCVYGEAYEPHMCRYALVTGKCRTIEYVNGIPMTGFCSKDKCNKFSRISKQNPRIEGRAY